MPSSTTRKDDVCGTCHAYKVYICKFVLKFFSTESFRTEYFRITSRTGRIRTRVRSGDKKSLCPGSGESAVGVVIERVLTVLPPTWFFVVVVGVPIGTLRSLKHVPCLLQSDGAPCGPALPTSNTPDQVSSHPTVTRLVDASHTFTLIVLTDGTTRHPPSVLNCCLVRMSLRVIFLSVKLTLDNGN